MRASAAHDRARRRAMAGIAGVLLLGAKRSLAVDSKAPLKLIVPAPVGVSSDRLGRVVADGLAQILGVEVLVENIAGDGGVTGTNAIAAGAKDGSVLGLAISSAIIGGKLLSRGARFRPIEDFQWLTILGTFPNAMVIAAKSPYQSVESWLAAARQAPSPWVYASVGTGSAGHLAGAYLRLDQGAKLVHRAVDSSDEGYSLLAEGKIAALFDGVPNAVIQAPRSGHRIVAVTSAVRENALPAVPSFGELWRQSFVVWIGVVVPKDLESGAYLRLAAAVGVLLSEPRYAESMRAAGLTFMGLSGRDTLAFLDAEFLRNAKLIASLSEEGQRN